MKRISKRVLNLRALRVAIKDLLEASGGDVKKVRSDITRCYSAAKSAIELQKGGTAERSIKFKPCKEEKGTPLGSGEDKRHKVKFSSLERSRRLKRRR